MKLRGFLEHVVGMLTSRTNGDDVVSESTAHIK